MSNSDPTKPPREPVRDPYGDLPKPDPYRLPSKPREDEPRA